MHDANVASSTLRTTTTTNIPSWLSFARRQRTFDDLSWSSPHPYDVGKAFLVLAALAELVASALFTDVSQLKKDSYDFVIVGGAF